MEWKIAVATNHYDKKIREHSTLPLGPFLEINCFV
jgi:hypothetical protein